MSRYSKRNVAAIAPGLRDGFGWVEGVGGAAGTVIAYSFGDRRDDTRRWVDAEEAGRHHPFTPREERMARRALDRFEEAAGVTFVEVDDPSDANFVFRGFRSGDVQGWGSFPAERQGYVAVKDMARIGEGSLWFYVLMHELGHAMGLVHPFEGVKLPRRLDNSNHTVMSYTTRGRPYENELGPLDRIALREAYGAPSDVDLEVLRNGALLKIATGDGDDAFATGIRSRAAARRSVEGEGGDDRLFAQSRKDRLYGGEGDDRLEAMDAEGAGLFGGAGEDRVILDAASGRTRAEGGEGDDVVISAARQRARLFGGDGDDRLDGGADDRVHGDAGNDRLSAVPGDARLFGGAGDDLLDGGAVARGGEGDDRLFGGLDVRGGTGDDLFFASSDEDADYRAKGGEGDDVFVFGARAPRRRPPEDPEDRARLIERLLEAERQAEDPRGGRLEGEAGDDLFVLNGAFFGEVLGGAGDDEARAAGRSGKAGFGWTRIDALAPDASDGLVLRGEEGDDVLAAGLRGGVAWLLGGEGDDALSASGARGQAALLGGAGEDELTGSDAHDQIFGGEDDDALAGGGGRDVLGGGAGDDDLDGGAGADRLSGGDGTDRLTGGDGRDAFLLERGSGLDRIADFDPGEDRLVFASAADRDGAVLAAEADGVRVAYGEGGDAVLLEGVDPAALDPAAFGLIGVERRLRADGAGGDGDDVLIAVGRPVEMTGGEGADVFVIEQLPRGRSGRHVIVDFDVSEDALFLDRALGDPRIEARSEGAALVFDGPRSSERTVLLRGIDAAAFEDVVFL
ncbi:MAG: hypothetical protein AAGI51_11185 [Pseudomonadota bacterium]